MGDPKLNVWHLALLTAILSLGYRQGERQKIKVSRSKLMKMSHINTLPTYHKYFKQLQEIAILSTVRLIIQVIKVKLNYRKEVISINEIASFYFALKQMNLRR